MNRAGVSRAGGLALLALALTFALPGCGGRGVAPTAPAAVIPASDSSPTWSPDGMRIAYAHHPGTEEPADRAGIYVMSADGGTPERILAGDYAFPHWSPDGRHLVVSGGGLWRITASGDSLTRLSSAIGYAAKWSPDGSTIAYQTYDERQVYRLWLMASDGTNVRCMNWSGTTSWFEPAWSPDGGYVMHVRWGVYVAQPQLFRMDPNGFDELQMTDGANEVRSPAVAPDGSAIAWVSKRGDVSEVWVAGADGTGARRVAEGLWPAWSPDSQRLAFVTAERWDKGWRVRVVGVASYVAGGLRTFEWLKRAA